MKKTGIVVLAAVLFVMAVTQPMSAFAATQQVHDNHQTLQVRYDGVVARVDFMSGVISDTASLVPQASANLNSHINILNSDLNTLNAYAAASNSTDFNSFIRDTLSPDMEASNEALKADAAHFKAWGVTKETREQLRMDYSNRKAAYQDAMSQETLALGTAKLAAYNSDINAINVQIANWSAKGIDTTGMKNVVNGAGSSVVAPLQSAVSAGDVNATREPLRSTCLYNGAPYSYHMAAKMDTERLKALTGKISANATAAGYGNQIANINTQLASAQDQLNQIGASPYTGDQRTSLFDTLKDASLELKTIIREMNATYAG
ncbi:MAG TPA: hypothetical protein VK436_02935 [Methanocella sp.]|nr:hypothetical protein [Methanocella sp.]